MKKEKIFCFFMDPIWALSVFITRHPLLIKDDETYLKWRFYHGLHKWPNLKNPQTFNEKLNWLKLHSKNPLYTQLVDKYAVKEWIGKQNIGIKLIPTLGIWDDFDSIDFEKLPNQFVLKCTHDSGGLIICKNKKKLDRHSARLKIEKCLKQNFFYRGREYPYKHVKPRIIAEQYMVDESGTELKDYKFFCFNGEPKMFFVASDRPFATKFDFFDLDFNHLPFHNGHPWAVKPINKPEHFEEMIEYARKLSKGFPHVRIDFYNINGDIYFGEMTFFHNSGFVSFEPQEWDYKIGEWLKLPL